MTYINKTPKDGTITAKMGRRKVGGQDGGESVG